jgi:hypothetical protein
LVPPSFWRGAGWGEAEVADTPFLEQNLKENTPVLEHFVPLPSEISEIILMKKDDSEKIFLYLCRSLL